jgi:hypothetical protein
MTESPNTPPAKVASPAAEGTSPPAGSPSPARPPLQPAPSLTDALQALLFQQPGEELPALGGRLLIGILLLAGIALVSPQNMNVWIDRKLHPEPVKHAGVWETGKDANVELTLITADAHRLNCASDTTLEGQHCGFTANKRVWPRAPGQLVDDNDFDVIQPYRTADTNALILVSGLWAQPELALRVHREPPSYYDVKKQLRFVAYCKVHFVGELKDVALRWDTAAKWAPEPKAMVAKALSCTLEPPQG